MEKSETYTTEQLEGTERALKILMSIPEEDRDIAAKKVSAFLEDMIAGKKKKDEETEKVFIGEK